MNKRIKAFIMAVVCISAVTASGCSMNFDTKDEPDFTSTNDYFSKYKNKNNSSENTATETASDAEETDESSEEDISEGGNIYEGDTDSEGWYTVSEGSDESQRSAEEVTSAPAEAPTEMYYESYEFGNYPDETYIDYSPEYYAENPDVSYEDAPYYYEQNPEDYQVLAEGTWTSSSGYNYVFYSDGYGGKITNPYSGTGLPFAVENSSDGYVFHMGAADNNSPANIEFIDDSYHSAKITWEDGSSEILMFVSGDTDDETAYAETPMPDAYYELPEDVF